MPPKQKPTNWKCPGCHKSYAPTRRQRMQYKADLAHAKKMIKQYCPKCASQIKPPSRPNRRPKHPKRQAKNGRFLNFMPNVSLFGSANQKSRSMAARSSAAQRGTIIPAKQRGIRASQSYLAMMLNPKATMGSKAIRFKSDAVQLPRVAYNFNSVFTVSPLSVKGETTNRFKIKFKPSPLIVAEIWTPGRLKIGGVPYVTVYNPDRSTTYMVLGSKVEQLGTLEGKTFIPRQDWAKYRCIGYSAGSMWVGREIDKSGIVYTARMNEEVPLNEFNPTLKQDAIFGRAFQEQSFTGMHKEPVYDWAHADPNESALDPDVPEPSEKIITWAYNGAHFPPDTVNWSLPSDFYIYGADFSRDTLAEGAYGLIQADYGADPTTFDKLMSTFFAKHFQSSSFPTFLTVFDSLMGFLQMYPTATNPSGWTHPIEFELKVTAYDFKYSRGPVLEYPTSTTFEVHINMPNQEIPINSASNMVEYFATAAIANDSLRDFVEQALLVNPDEHFVYFGIDIKVSSHVPVTKRIRENHKRGLREYDLFAEIQWEDSAGMFEDDTWANPVAYFEFPTDEASHSFMMQFVHQTNLELVVDDTSPLANFAIAQESSNRSDVVDHTEVKLQRVMRALPPMLTFDNGQLGSTSSTELSSRGVIKDIADVLGPLFATIFPEFAPFIGGAQALAGAFDSLILS